MLARLLPATVALALLAASAARGNEGDSADLHIGYFIGGGAGFQAGNGVHGGIVLNRNRIQLGFGMLYRTDDAVLRYSVGLRYLRDIVRGKALDTYVWVGGSVYGRKWPDTAAAEDDDSRYVVDVGAGPGFSMHFGLPIHLGVDTGVRFFRPDNEKSFGIQVSPTINGSLVYHW